MLFGTSLFSFFLLRYKWKHFFSRVRLGRTVMLPVLMAVNYADKVSAVKAASQKT